VAWRRVEDGATTATQTQEATYDISGRPRTLSDSLSGQTITNTYDGFDLVSISQDAGSWGSRTLQFAYDDPYGRLTKETYPNGRSTTYAYTAKGEIGAIKDPFGFVTKLGYDDMDRLATLSHSTLGTASFDYEDNF